MKIITLLVCMHVSALIWSQDNTGVIAQVQADLQTGKKSVSSVLTDPALMHLHSLSSFREVIMKNAPTGEIEIVTLSERGVRATIHGKLLNGSGQPVANALVYFYQTDDRGWYSDTEVHILKNAGDFKHSRLFGYVKTDANGKFTLRTIRPNGYPLSDLAAHIHIHFWNADGTPMYDTAGELQFEDDIRMTPARKKRSLEEGYLIAKNEGTAERAVYHYLIKCGE